MQLRMSTPVLSHAALSALVLSSGWREGLTERLHERAGGCIVSTLHCHFEFSGSCVCMHFGGKPDIPLPPLSSSIETPTATTTPLHNPLLYPLPKVLFVTCREHRRRAKVTETTSRLLHLDGGPQRVEAAGCLSSHFRLVCTLIRPRPSNAPRSTHTSPCARASHHRQSTSSLHTPKPVCSLQHCTDFTIAKRDRIPSLQRPLLASPCHPSTPRLLYPHSATSTPTIAPPYIHSLHFTRSLSWLPKFVFIAVS